MIENHVQCQIQIILMNIWNKYLTTSCSILILAKLVFIEAPWSLLTPKMTSFLWLRTGHRMRWGRPLRPDSTGTDEWHILNKHNSEDIETSKSSNTYIYIYIHQGGSNGRSFRVHSVSIFTHERPAWLRLPVSLQLLRLTTWWPEKVGTSPSKFCSSPYHRHAFKRFISHF